MQENEGTTSSAENSSGSLSRSRRKNKKEKVRKEKVRRSAPKLPIWMVLLLVVGSGILGLIVGFSFVGKGSILEALDISNYKHMYDLVFKNN